MARGKNFIPATAGDLTPQWLTDQLRAHGDLSDEGEVVGFRISSISGGQGLSGDLMRVTLDYAGEAESAPDTVIAKFPTANTVNRGMIEHLGTYEREIEFYRHASAEVPVRMPRHFGSEYDPQVLPAGFKSGTARVLEKLPGRVHVFLTRDVSKFMRATDRRFALLIEDMGEGEVHDMTSPPSPDRLQTVLEHLAQLHAHFWGETGLVGRISSGKTVTDIPLVQRHVSRSRAVPACLERWPEMAGSAHEDMLREAIERFPDDVARLNRPITMIHGDPRSDNMMFYDDGTLAILDWAMPSFADPGYDLGYVISSCVEPDDGRPMARKLAEHYHATLRSNGVEYSFDELWASTEATCRAQVVQQALSLVFFEGHYGDQDLCDFWMPRTLGVLVD
ncbi:MAG: phosphotransferase family protein [Acidimicrobiales bacterium]